MLYLLTQKGRLSRAKAKELFQIILRQSRNPAFYERYAIPDTLEGRFEMISLHGGLLVNRLCRPDMGREGKILAQAFFDVMFKNIDWGIREMGVGDLAVPRRIKKMMSDFKGRAYAYDEACRSGKGELTHALVRNIYANGQKPSQDNLNEFAQYVQNCVADLEKQGLSDFWRGMVTYPSISSNSNSYGIHNESEAA
jgi:cytochrome b pre-mRNA-processing protein 3